MLLLWLFSFCLDVWLRKKMFSLSLSLFLTNLHLKSIYFFRVRCAHGCVCAVYAYARIWIGSILIWLAYKLFVCGISRFVRYARDYLDWHAHVRSYIGL